MTNYHVNEQDQEISLHMNDIGINLPESYKKYLANTVKPGCFMNTLNGKYMYIQNGCSTYELSEIELFPYDLRYRRKKFSIPIRKTNKTTVDFSSNKWFNGNFCISDWDKKPEESFYSLPIGKTKDNELILLEINSNESKIFILELSYQVRNIHNLEDPQDDDLIEEWSWKQKFIARNFKHFTELLIPSRYNDHLLKNFKIPSSKRNDCFFLANADTAYTLAIKLAEARSVITCYEDLANIEKNQQENELKIIKLKETINNEISKSNLLKEEYKQAEHKREVLIEFLKLNIIDLERGMENMSITELILIKSFLCFESLLWNLGIIKEKWSTRNLFE